MQSRVSKRQFKRRNDFGNTFLSKNFRVGTKDERDKQKKREKSQMSLATDSQKNDLKERAATLRNTSAKSDMRIQTHMLS